MSTIVEDGSPAIAYSGGWSVVSSSDASGGTVHSTSSSGSTAIIKFSGNWITVFGTNPSSNTPAHLYATFTVDGRDYPPWDKTVHAQAYYKDRFWDSGQLSPGTHTLVIKNTGSTPAFMLDYIDVNGSPSMNVNPPASPPTASTVQQPPPAQTNNDNGGSTVVSTLTVSGSATTATQTFSGSASTVTSSSTVTQTGTSTATRSGTVLGLVSQSVTVDPETGQTVTAFQVVTTSISGAPAELTLYPDGNGGFGASGAARKDGVPIGVLVGALVGAVLFLVFVVLFVVLFLRRRKRAAALAQALENARAQPMDTSGHNPSPSFSHRISERLGPAIASKFRGHQENRQFQRLDEESSSGLSSSHGRATAPTLPLNLYPNEKDSTFMGSGFDGATSDTHTSYASPMVSNASAVENVHHDPEEAPPAYSNRLSNVPRAMH